MSLMKKVMVMWMVAVMAWSINTVVFAEENQPKTTEAPVVSAPAEPIAAPEEKTEAPAATPAESQEAPAATPEASQEAQAQPETTPESTVQPETTDTAADTETENVEEEAVEETSDEEEMIDTGNEEVVPDVSNIKITIHCLNEGEVYMGDSVTLAVSIQGADGLSYSIQWQYFDGSEWKDQSGACDTTITYTLNQENADYAWRVILTVV